MRDWKIRDGQLVLIGTENPGQRATVINNPLHGQDGYVVTRRVGQEMRQRDVRPSLAGAIRLAEQWVREQHGTGPKGPTVDEDVDQCEALTGRGSRCKRTGYPSIPDARGLRYICRQHWANPPTRYIN